MNAKEWVAALHKSGKPGPLMATLREGKQADIAVRLKALTKHAEDPAVGEALLEIANSPPWTSDSSKPLWRLVFELASKTKDPRHKEARPTWEVRPLIKGWLSNSWQRAVAELPEMTPAQRQKLAGAKKTVSTRNTTDSALLEAIFSAPDDDVPRQIYADALLERGDPRGEFISLQLAGRDEKKQKALLKEHGKKWLGELAEVVGAGYEFRRGFLAKATIKFRNKADFEKWGSRPEWATVEEVNFAGRGIVPDGQAEFIYAITPAMKGLKRAYGVERAAIVDAKEPWALEALSVQFDQQAMKALFESKRFPKLQKLELKEKTAEAVLFAGLTGIGAVKHFVAKSRVPKAMVEAASRFPFETLTINGTVHTPKKVDVAPQHKAAKAEPFPSFDWLDGLDVRADGSLTVVTNEEIWHVDATGTRLLNRAPRSEDDAEADCYATTFLPDGSVLTSEYRSLTVIDPVTGSTKTLKSKSVENHYRSQCPISADGRFVSVMGNAVFDLQKRTELKPPNGAGKARFMSPDQHWWVVIEHVGDMKYQSVLMRAGSKNKVPLEHAIDVEEYATAGGRIYGATERELLVWDLTSGKCIARRKSAPNELRFTRDGGLMLATNKGTGEVLDAATLKSLGKWPAHALAMSPDHRSVWAATTNKKLTLKKHAFGGAK